MSHARDQQRVMAGVAMCLMHAIQRVMAGVAMSFELTGIEKNIY